MSMMIRQDAQMDLFDINSFEGPTKYVAMDCEMVGVGPRGRRQQLGRVSIVNYYGHVLYDTCVKPREKVTNYRTHVSGLTREKIENGKDFKTAQKDVKNILKGKILIGHSLTNDLKVLHFHQQFRMYDTQKYAPFRTYNKGQLPGLKTLAFKIRNIDIQEGMHDSVEDARVAMRLFVFHRLELEKMNITFDKINHILKQMKKQGRIFDYIEKNSTLYCKITMNENYVSVKKASDLTKLLLKTKWVIPMDLLTRFTYSQHQN
ncbi:unnamed protein product [Meganyctiphanes norvegica]|uniref:RNA exonuclease 4 n=1 Tax=Meganyctiphanes norvegica TaxID=48144 RepID=A0AAV2R005_MEGNR